MLNNLRTLLGELGLGLSNVLRTTIKLTGYMDFDVLKAVSARRLNEPFPVRITVQVAALPLGAKAQIDTVVGFQDPSGRGSAYNYRADDGGRRSSF